MSSIQIFIAMLFSLAILTYGNFCSVLIIQIIFKALTSILFLGIAHFAMKEYTTQTTSKYYKLMFLGLFFSMLGDVLLVLDSSSNGILFVIGVICFATAHICYAIAFFQFGKLSKLNMVWTVIFAVPLIYLVAFTPFFDFQGLRPMILGYAVLISFMVGKSFSLWQYRCENRYFVYLTMAGAILFLLSDTILLFALFGDESLHQLQTLNNIIYYIGQGLFGLSFKKEYSVSKQK